MKFPLLKTFAAIGFAIALSSCADEKTTPAGPTSTSGTMPWNVPVQGQGQGQFGMMPQNQHRR